MDHNNPDASPEPNPYVDALYEQRGLWMTGCGSAVDAQAGRFCGDLDGDDDPILCWTCGRAVELVDDELDMLNPEADDASDRGRP